MITITISTSDDAWASGPSAMVRFILQQAHDKILKRGLPEPGDPIKLIDLNGNTVGHIARSGDD